MIEKFALVGSSSDILFIRDNKVIAKGKWSTSNGQVYGVQFKDLIGVSLVLGEQTIITNDDLNKCFFMKFAGNTGEFLFSNEPKLDEMLKGVRVVEEDNFYWGMVPASFKDVKGYNDHSIKSMENIMKENPVLPNESESRMYAIVRPLQDKDHNQRIVFMLDDITNEDIGDLNYTKNFISVNDRISLISNPDFNVNVYPIHKNNIITLPEPPSIKDYLRRQCGQTVSKLTKEFFTNIGKTTEDSFDYEDKNQVYIELATNTYFIEGPTIFDGESKTVRHITISFAEYCQGDYVQTTSEGCHYQSWGSVYMRPSDIDQAVMLYEVLKMTGIVDFNKINEIFFKGELNFLSIDELHNEQQIQEEIYTSDVEKASN